jgi:hypothetical protein
MMVTVLAVLLTPAPAHAAGTVSAADRDFLTRTHAAASFAAAASQLAQTKASAPVRALGKKVLEQDKKLDGLVRTAATKLQSPLPSTPADPALATLKAAGADAFDAGYVDRLRADDGALLQLAAGIRAYTRNDVVRGVAQQATTTMVGQMPLLEGSGLVDYTELPTAAPVASASAAARSGPNADPGMLVSARHRDGFLWPSVRVNLVVLGVAVLIALVAVRRVFGRSRRLRN